MEGSGVIHTSEASTSKVQSLEGSVNVRSEKRILSQQQMAQTKGEKEEGEGET